MDTQFTSTPADFAATLAATTLTAEQQAAVAAAWTVTNQTVADQYQASFAISDEGGWTVVRIAAFHTVS